MKYGGEAMLTMMVMLYYWIWKKDYAPRTWRKVVVNVCKKGDKAGLGNFGGMALRSTVGKIMSYYFNERRTTMEKEARASRV